MVPLKSVAVQWLEFLSFDIDTVMNKQYLDVGESICFRNIGINFLLLQALKQVLSTSNWDICW